MAISPPVEPFHDGLDIPSPELYSMQLDEPHIPSPPPESDDEPETDPGSLDDIDHLAHVRATSELECLRQRLADSERHEQEPGDGPQDEDTYSSIQSIAETQAFISAIEKATYRNGNLKPETIALLSNPPQSVYDLSNLDEQLCLEILLGLSNASEACYNATIAAVQRRFPECELLSHYRAKQLLAKITGIVSVTDDMCINGCHAYTGPYSVLEQCKVCSEPRYDKEKFEQTGNKVPRLTFETILLGPQLQALRRSKQGCVDHLYWQRKTEQILDMIQELDPAVNGTDMRYNDIFCGSDYLEFAQDVG
ncbi:hypothetical protein VKT23_009966 [Stygiomarasmius scandens]|uniref:Uncharacterized protein n=1 Tax=Marasmiellus scandens TaxID=2682957 RepID=A0ABR1JFE6_9AGAR